MNYQVCKICDGSGKIDKDKKKTSCPKCLGSGLLIVSDNNLEPIK